MFVCIEHNEVLMVREVAAELIRMADEFNESVVSEAAERLAKKLSNSSEEVSIIYRIISIDHLYHYSACAME